MDLPYKIALKVQRTENFKQLLLTNYMEHSNGLSLPHYAARERRCLSMGTYGVEDFHHIVKNYIDFLDGIIE